jgi:hypothetical protein
LEYVLSLCRVALIEGRYTWHHDQVLKTIAAKVDTARRQKGHVEGKLKFLDIQKTGERQELQANNRTYSPPPTIGRRKVSTSNSSNQQQASHGTMVTKIKTSSNKSII